MKYEHSKRIYILFLKYSPMVGALLCMSHYCCMLRGIRTINVDYLADTSLLSFLFVFLSSIVFGFCRLHRAFISYIGITSLDIDLCQWLHPCVTPRIMPVVMIVAAVVLFLLLIIKEIKDAKKGCGFIAA